MHTGSHGNWSCFVKIITEVQVWCRVVTPHKKPTIEVTSKYKLKPVPMVAGIF